MNGAEALAAASLPSPLEGGGVLVNVVGEPTPAGVRLNARPAGGGGVTVPSEILSSVELNAPGDTRLTVDAGGLAASRLLVDPAPSHVRDAAYELAALLAVLAESAAVHAEGIEAGRELASIEAPTFPEQPMFDSLMARYRTVRSSQPAWTNPDPTLESQWVIDAGEPCELLDVQGGWAQVRIEGGHVVWTNVEALVPMDLGTEEER